MNNFRGVFTAMALLAVLAGKASAQEATDKKTRESDDPKTRFFDRPIDYWKSGITYPKKKDKKAKTPTKPAPAGEQGTVPVDDLWATPQQTPDGRWVVHRPPKHVRDFLDSPSRETLKGYLSVKLRRTLKMRGALRFLRENREEVLRELLEELGDTLEGLSPSGEGSLTPDAKVKESGGKWKADISPRPPFKLLYFHKST